MRNSSSHIEKLKAGDERAYWKLFEEYFDQFLNYALTALKSADLAESVLEDSFAELWEHRELLDPHISLEKQLFGIIERRVFDVLGSAVADRKLDEKIWQGIKKAMKLSDDRLLDEEQTSLLKVIHNNILQQQLLHELAATRR